MRSIKRLVKSVFVLIMCIGLLGVSIWGYARYIEPNLLIATKYEVEVPEDVAACRVVFFSDTHLGRLYPEENLEKLVEKINEQAPDVIIFGGDFFDHYARDKEILDVAYITDCLAAIKAPYGKYAVYGNHDYGGGADKVYQQMMTQAGFYLFNDSNVFIEGLNLRIIGFDDYLMGYTNQELYTLKSETYNIILSHEPDVADFMRIPTEGMVLSGHSHGGQVRLPILTESVLPRGAKKYVRGYYPNTGQDKDLPLYVSTGVGMTVYPYRFLNIPEIMVLDLKPR